MTNHTQTTTIAPKYLTKEGLASAYYRSYDEDSPYTSQEIAQEIHNRDRAGESFANWPLLVIDALDELGI